MKRVIVAALVLLMLPAMAAAEVNEASLETISAASAILIEAGSGRVLYAHNADEKRAMASTTKIMTALVAVELGRPEAILKVQADCVKIEGTSLYLEENEELTLLDMLYGLMLRSGNDAAAAIGKYVAGDIDHFVSLMNQKAWDLGMTGTKFANPHGLDALEHYSTARDMAALGAAFLKKPLLRQICVTEEYISRELTGGRVRLFKNNNKLLLRDPRACGIKIGWTEKAGRCLVAAGRVGDLELIAVVLGAPDLYTDASKLLDFGFRRARVQELVPKGKIMAILPVVHGQAGRVAAATAAPIHYPVFPDETLSFTAKVQVPAALQAPVQRGQVVGAALFQVDADWTVEVELVAVTTVQAREGFAARLLKLVRGWWRD